MDFTSIFFGWVAKKSPTRVTSTKTSQSTMVGIKSRDSHKSNVFFGRPVVNFSTRAPFLAS